MRIKLVTRVIYALALASTLLAGCTKEQEATTSATARADADKAALEERANDPVYQEKLATQKAQQTKLLVLREKLLAEQASCEKDSPEWQSLQKRLAAAEQAYEDNRKQSMAIIRQRINQQVTTDLK